jgi:hypothetical protein
MIIDQSRVLGGISISRMSEYLSLCKIDCLVRKVDFTTPSCHVDHPSKVGTSGTMAFLESEVYPEGKAWVSKYYPDEVDDTCLILKNKLSSIVKNPIDSISKVSFALISQGRECGLGTILIFKMIFRTDNFANERNVLYFCFVDINHQDTWVKHLVNTFIGVRRQPDCIFAIRGNQIKHYWVPKSKGDN